MLPDSEKHKNAFFVFVEWPLCPCVHVFMHMYRDSIQNKIGWRTLTSLSDDSTRVSLSLLFVPTTPAGTQTPSFRASVFMVLLNEKARRMRLLSAHCVGYGSESYRMLSLHGQFMRI